MKEWASLFVGKKETGESPLIELKHLGKTFQDGAKPVVAIKDINLTIEDGDIFGVIGLSGAG